MSSLWLYSFIDIAAHVVAILIGVLIGVWLMRRQPDETSKGGELDD